MNILSAKKQILFGLFFITCLFSYSQKEKITGRWKPVRIVMEKVPEGMDLEWAEKKLYEDIHKRLDSAGKIREMNAADSARIKAIAQEAIDEVFQQVYFRFNPDNTCYLNFGKLLDETSEQGTNFKGKYKNDEAAASITIITDKNQKIAGEETKVKKDKVLFFYSFNSNGQLRMEMDDGSMVFYLVKEE